MDNRLLNINGKGQALFGLAIQTAFSQAGSTASLWTVTKEHGFILLSYVDGSQQATDFPTPIDWKLAAEIVWNWLDKISIEDFTLAKWEKNLDHDGSNSRGWRVYVDDWGKVGNHNGVICAVKPVYLWHGK